MLVVSYTACSMAHFLRRPDVMSGPSSEGACKAEEIGEHAGCRELCASRRALADQRAGVVPISLVADQVLVTFETEEGRGCIHLLHTHLGFPRGHVNVRHVAQHLARSTRFLFARKELRVLSVGSLQDGISVRVLPVEA